MINLSHLAQVHTYPRSSHSLPGPRASELKDSVCDKNMMKSWPRLDHLSLFPLTRFCLISHYLLENKHEDADKPLCLAVYQWRGESKLHEFGVSEFFQLIVDVWDCL